MILDAFLTVIRNAIYGDAITAPGYIALGTGSTAAAGTDTTLETEVERKACSNTKSGTDTVAYAATWSTAEGNGNTFSEVGAIDSAAVGILANRQIFPGFSKDNLYELRVQVYIKCENK